ncbi:MAG: hypothetical protein J6R93_01390 [Tidjanibacter sp.]|nr:hypothetical protein [Tidjanibacter sp.]
MKLMKIFALCLAALTMWSCHGDEPEPTPEGGGKLAAPAGLEIVDGSLGTDRASVSWGAVANAVGYKYKVLASGTLVTSGETTATQLDITGLEKKTEYGVQVMAVAEAPYENSLWSSLFVFTTRLRDGSESGPSVVVAQDGTGDFQRVQDALNSIPANNATPYIIHIKEGTYKEKLLIGKGKDNVILVGDGAEKTILSWDDCQGTYNGADSSLPETQRRSYTLRVESERVQIHDLTIENTHQNNTGSGDQAMAVEVKYGKVSFFDCRITGYQDTFLGRDDSARIYLKGCFVEGNVDFIYGASVMVFDHCQIHANREQTPITAPSTAAAAPYGIVFFDCEVTHDEVGFNGQKVNNIYLGRAWQNGSKSVWIRCKMPKALHADGWMENMNSSVVEEKKIFAEWGCTYEGADASARKNGGRVLTDDEAATYTLANIFADVENLTEFTTKYGVEL